MTRTMMSPGAVRGPGATGRYRRGMLLSVIAVVVGLVAGTLAGGSWRNAAQAPVRRIGLLLAGVVCEFVAGRWGSGWTGLAFVIAGYVLLLAFAASNLTLTGMVLVAVGLLANLTVIAVNGGMPVRGVPPGATYGPRHHGLRPGDHLIGLADVLHVSFLGETLAAGDIVLAVGVATVIAALLRPCRRAPAGSSVEARSWPNWP
jgi:Family of unknown function (DUF5317)